MRGRVGTGCTGVLANKLEISANLVHCHIWINASLLVVSIKPASSYIGKKSDFVFKVYRTNKLTYI